MTLKTVKIYPSADSVTMESTTKKITLRGASSELHAVQMALAKIENPCKIEIFSNHRVLKRLLPEIPKSVHNMNDLCDGGFDKYLVQSILIDMKKIVNITLTDR